MNFIHLHTHSDNSILDGYGRVEEYVALAKEYGMKAIALTDHNTLSGAYAFMKECKKNDIKPIIGVEFNVAPEHRNGAKNKSEVFYSNNSKQIILGNGKYTHLTVLAKNETGLKNLFELVKLSSYPENAATHENKKGDLVIDEFRIDLDLLIKYKEGLIVLSGCPHSELNVRFRLDQDNKAYKYASRMKEIFKDDFYIEVIHNKFIPNYNPGKLFKLSKELGIKMVLTNDVHYAKKEDSYYQEFFPAAKNKNNMNETPSYKGGLRPALGGDDRYFKSFDDMNAILPYEKFKELYDTTVEIADKIENISLEYDSHLRPKIEIPKEFSSELEYFDYLVQKGFDKKRKHQSVEIQEESKKRIAEEREIIYGNDFVSYLLVVKDYIDWYANQGYMRSIGRGSVGGSEIAFLLDISQVDPIRYDLLFERFISDGRGAVYEIEYEDGTVETKNVSEKSILESGDLKFTHELKVGDIIKG